MVEFTPTTTDPVQLVVTIAPPAGQTSTVYLDDASLSRTGSYGIVATPSYWDLPPQLQTPTVKASAQTLANFTLENGSIVQGGGGSYGASDVYGLSGSGTTINGVTATAYGDDTDLIYLQYAINAVVENSDIVGGIQRISNRMDLFAAVYLAEAAGTVQVSGNTITGSMDTGILVYRGGTVTSPVTISGNTIEQDTVVTDGYGVVLNNVENFTVTNNFIDPVNGRGLILDTFSSGVTLNGTVSGNTIEAQEHPNLEYSAIGLEAVAMTVRVFATGEIRNVTFTNNTFSAQTGVGGDWAAIGVRVSIADNNTQMANSGLVFQNNTFQAVVTAVNPSLGNGPQSSTAWAVSVADVPAGTGLEFLDNTFASNDVSVNFGDDTGYEGTVANVLFVGSTISKLSQGAAMNYIGVAAGDWQDTTTNVWLIDTSYTGGATSAIAFLGTVSTSNVEVGWLLNLTVDNANGSAATGDTVSLLNGSNQQVYSGVTNAQGQLIGIAVVTTTYQQSATNSSVVTATSAGPFTVVVNQGGTQETFVIGTLTSDTSDTIKLT